MIRGTVMIYLCCTKKLLDDLHIKADKPIVIGEEEALLGNWYANLIRVMRHKFILFVNERTLFSFVSKDFKQARQSGLGSVLVDQLKNTLASENISDAKVQLLSNELSHVTCSKTANRSVLGSMNDLTHLYRYQLEGNGSLSPSSLIAAAKQINRTPQQNLGWGLSVEVLSEILKKKQFN